MYRYKYYYKDGTEELSKCCGITPESMYNDFDGLMDWDEFDNLDEKQLTTKDVLQLAFKLYKNHLKDYYRIEIINDENNEVVEYLDESEVKK